jgi:electron transfer flavoprotein alpha subunit
MPGALVYVETDENGPTRGSLGLLAAAQRVAPPARPVLCGVGVTEHAAVAASAAAADGGADEIYVADDPQLEGAWAPPRIALLHKLVLDLQPNLVVFENSALTADIAGALSARLEAGVNWDLIDLWKTGDEWRATRMALSDSIAVEVGWSRGPRLGIFRRGAFEPAPEHAMSGVAPAIIPLALGETAGTSSGGTWLGRTDRALDDASLDSADVVVAGGRGVKDQQSFHLLEELAATLGGAVAVTMPIVDRGWYPYAHQVGQTGRTVRPRLYLACGISGAVQHRVGMQGAEFVVAINSDPDAPIFGVCDVGLVGDLHEVVPRLTELAGNAARS